MNFSTLSAIDKRVLIAGAVAAIVALISFVDPSGQWGVVMILALLGGLGAVFVALQTQVAPAMRMPVTKGLSLLVSGGAATAGFAVAMLSYIGYISQNITDIFVLLMIVGLVVSIFLLWTAWQVFRGEPRAAAPPAPPTTPPPASTPTATPAAAPSTPAASDGETSPPSQSPSA